MRLFVRDRSFYKKLLQIAIPVVLQSVITIGVNMMDTLMVGQLGEAQLSATSLANEFINLFQILCFGMGYGAAVLTSQYWGQQDIPSFRKAVTIMLRLCLIISGAFTLAAFLVPASIMRLFTPDQELIRQGLLYMEISVWTFLPMGISLTITAVLRSFGEVKVSLLASIIAFFVNIFFNWVFIFGNLGAPRMEVRGAALGTLIARLFEVVFIFGYFIIIDQKVKYRIKDFFVSCKGYYMLYITYSIPVLISDTLLGVGNSLTSVIMGHIGSSFVAANAIVSQVTRLTTIFNTGVSNASSVMTGNTLGEGDSKKAYDQGITFLSLSVILGAVAGGILLMICPFIVNSFSISEDATGIAYQMMYAIAVLMIFNTVQGVLTKGVLRGGGDTRFLMAADVLFLWLVSIPFGALAGLVSHLPAFWIYIALRADYIIKSVWCTLRLFKGNWMKKVSVKQASVEE